jgi:chemotaxis protein methyltransferase CheR
MKEPFLKPSTFNKVVNLLPAEFIILRDLIHEKLGIYYQDSKRDLIEDKLSDLVLARGFTSFLDYYYLLKYDSAMNREWEQVIDALRVPETFFWREHEQIQTLVNTRSAIFLTIPNLSLENMECGVF